MSNSFYHKDLTEAQWNRIKFVFEEPAKVGRPPSNPRTVFNAIMWILKSGARLGLFQRLFKLVNADANNPTLLEIDSTFCKVHQSACSALKDEAIGASRGDIINERMQLLNVIDRAYSSEQIRLFLRRA